MSVAGAAHWVLNPWPVTSVVDHYIAIRDVVFTSKTADQTANAQALARGVRGILAALPSS
jgi:hypothetical protein